MIHFSVSPCSNPEMALGQALAAYAQIGFERFEVFTGWVKSAVDPGRPPQEYLALAEKHGFRFSSIHLPTIGEDVEGSVARAARVCRFGAELGCPVAIVKAKSKEAYVAGGRLLLDRIEETPIVPAVTNHAGTAISTLEDYRDVMGGIDDERIKCLLEVGHFHSVGVSWREGYDTLAGRIALVHVKDQVGSQSVPFGKGEIDLPGLSRRLAADGYDGDVVIEMEVEDKENTLEYLADALRYAKELV